MGYYTDFRLEVIGDEYHDSDHETEVSRIADYLHCFQDDIKWYNYRENMIEHSLKYPDITFKLSGEGEETGDLWREYYKNGKYQRCEAVIVYADFDESKLI